MTDATAQTDTKPADTTTAAATTGATTAATTTAATTTDTKPAAATTAADTKGGTILETKDDGKTVAAPADWPTDWREKIAGADAKRLEQLKRYADPIAIAQKAFALEQKLSSGELKPVGLTPDAIGKLTPEKLAEYRKEHGIPEQPKNYSIELPGGKKFDEADGPTIEKFLSAAHAKHWSQAQVTEQLEQLHAAKADQAERVQTFDGENLRKAEDALRAAWGADYRANVNVVDGFLSSSMPEELAVALMQARLPDGRKVGATPEFFQWARSLAAEFPSLAPSADPGGKSDGDRLKEIREFARANPDKYDADKAMQKEQVDILNRQMRAKPRAA